MKMNRRTALAGAGAATLASLGGPVVAQAPVRVRRGAHALSATSDDVVAFGEGLALMKRRNDARSWARQNDLHRRNGQHNNGLFLPWHRLQTLHLEQIIAGLTGHSTFAMPYWDAQQHKTMPSWVSDREAGLYERRRAASVEALDFNAARWARSPYVARLETDGFETFAGKLPEGAGMVEGYGHNYIHELVGGLMKVFSTAALDPFFWMHHANIDRVWATWHVGRGADVYPEDWTRRTLDGFIGRDGETTGDWRIGDVLETRRLGYVYDALYPFPTFNVPEMGPPGATRRMPTGGTVYRVVSTGPGESGRLEIRVPEDALARMRAADDSLMIEGIGSVAFAREAGLLDRSIEIRMTCGGRSVSLGSSPTFVHLPEDGHVHHRGDYVLPFRFGEEVLNLLADADGPAAIAVEAEDLSPDRNRAPARATGLELTLTLTESRWA
jgi:hypothetical protein